MATFIPIILSSQNVYFEDFRYSTNDFYSSVETRLKDQGIPDVSFSRIKLSKGAIFSGKREYLRIGRNEYRFDICAAPFGKGFFVSWWFGEKDSAWREMLSRIPVIGSFVAKVSKAKTYYQLDTESMFRECVKKSISYSIESISTANGFRISNNELDALDKRTIATN